MNTCYNLLDVHVEQGYGDDLALIYDSPITGVKKKYTYQQMKTEAAKFARILVNMGVQKGDRVVIYMPMVPEALFAIHGCSRIGAVHSVVFGGFASQELSKRIDHCEPKVIVTATCGYEPGRIVRYQPLVEEALNLSSHQPNNVVVVDRMDEVTNQNAPKNGKK